MIQKIKKFIKKNLQLILLIIICLYFTVRESFQSKNHKIKKIIKHHSKGPLSKSNVNVDKLTVAELRHLSRDDLIKLVVFSCSAWSPPSNSIFSIHKTNKKKTHNSAYDENYQKMLSIKKTNEIVDEYEKKLSETLPPSKLPPTKKQEKKLDTEFRNKNTGITAAPINTKTIEADYDKLKNRYPTTIITTTTTNN